MSNSQFPKTIWYLWMQGPVNLPELIEFCYKSWLSKNPDWDLIFICQDNLSQYLSVDVLNLIDNNNLSLQAKSDIIRINLLDSKGGVWVDSTCFCCNPLDEWLFDYLKSDFFAFSSPPGRSTMISSWFLASKPNSFIVKQFSSEVNSYMLRTSSVKFWRDVSIYKLLFKITGLHRFLNKRPHLWFQPIFERMLKVRPYYWFHYTFGYLYNTDSRFRDIWNGSIHLSSNFPHAIQHYGLFKPLSNSMKLSIERVDSPVYKLNWRIDWRESPVLSFLFDQHNSKP